MFEIGPSLREARLKQGLTPEDVQKAIRIRDRYLFAIEEERWELLPGEAYAKGFLRTYAEFLGLDGNLYVDEFNERFAHREEGSLAPETLAPVRLGRVGIVRPLLAIAAIVAVVAAVAAWQLRGGSQPASNPHAGAANAAERPAGKPAAGKHEQSGKHATRPAAKPATRPERAVLSAARGPVWLLVRAGGPTGAVIYEGTLQQGQTLPVRLAPRVWFRVGAPWNLDVRVGGRLVHGLPSAPANLLLSARGLTPAS
ncbi:MAG: DUF4115 domain-containing protein [Thermoleophilia bacterium]|nr:DUF4115 domain-containing protein [Thermoleophilia bacterium]